MPLRLFAKAAPLGLFLLFFWFISNGALVAQIQPACAGNALLPETVQAAPPRLDTTFNPVLESFAATTNSKILPLPDGKVLGICAGSLCRLNSAGTLEATFPITGSIGALLRQPDGKFLLSGSQINAHGTIYNGVRRFNPDLTLDPTFNPVGLLGASQMTLQSDGKIVITGTHADTGAAVIHRLNPDGSRDVSFNGPSGFPIIIVSQPDFKTLVSFSTNGGWSGNKPVRLNANGSPDASFNTTNAPSIQDVKSILLQPDGKIVYGGNNLARLNPDGSRDETFVPGLNFSNYLVLDLAWQPDGKIVLGGYPYSYSSPYPAVRERVARINADGSLDNTFSVGAGFETNFNDTVFEVNVLSDGRILAAGSFTFVDNQERPGLVRLNPNGNVDASFDSRRRQPGGSVDILFRQPDRKILIGGVFDFLDNNASRYIARLNADGTTDTTFHSNAAIRGKIKVFAVQPDGKVLVGGEFQLINSSARGLIRLNADGTMDNTFVSPTSVTQQYNLVNGIYAIAVLNDGKILIGGSFVNINNSGRSFFVRLNPDGTIDTSYTVRADLDANNPWASFALMLRQSTGKIVTNGKLTQNGVTRTFARLNPDGNLDTSFNFPSTSGAPYALLADDRIMSGGYIYNGCTYTGLIYRFSPDAIGDPTFTTTLSGGYGLGFQFRITDRQEVIYNDQTGYRKLKPNGGGIDNTFSLALQGNTTDILFSGNKLYVGGTGAIGVNGVYRTGLMRLIYGASPFDYDGDGKSDISIFRPSAGEWYILRSSDGASLGVNFGLQNDLIAPADFDGDGKTDISVFRPTDGGWYRLNSSNDTFSALQFGTSGDLPVPGDFDGDLKADITVYRPSAGSWYRINSSNNQFIAAQFGIAEDKPLVGDFDGDGKSDLTVFRPSNGTWYRINSATDTFSPNQFGAPGDLPVAADYDGDGKTDLAVYRPSNGSWYLINSGNNSFAAAQFGIAEDKPSPADFDGDGRADLAVFRPSSGTWYLLRSGAGFIGQQYGAGGDVPTPNAFVR